MSFTYLHDICELGYYRLPHRSLAYPPLIHPLRRHGPTRRHKTFGSEPSLCTKPRLHRSDTFIRLHDLWALSPFLECAVSYLCYLAFC